MLRESARVNKAPMHLLGIYVLSYLFSCVSCDVVYPPALPNPNACSVGVDYVVDYVVRPHKIPHSSPCPCFVLDFRLVLLRQAGYELARVLPHKSRSRGFHRSTSAEGQAPEGAGQVRLLRRVFLRNGLHRIRSRTRHLKCRCWLR